MNQITNPPNEYDAGLDFDYSAWAANTQITLTNMRLGPEYSIVLTPAKALEVNAKIDARPGNITYTNSKYVPVDRPIRLDRSHAQLSRFNYVRVFNPAQPSALHEDRPVYLYYFITDVSYIATDTTEIHVQLDVWTTYINNIRFGRGFVERSHLGIANENQMDANGRTYLAVPEGLDAGVDHVVAHAGGDAPIMRYGDHGVMVTATLDLEMNPGSTNKPIINVADAQVSAGMLTGVSQYLFPNVNAFIAFVKSRKNAAHLIAGITSVVFIPNPDRYWSRADLGALLSIGAYRMPQALARPRRKVSMSDWRNNNTILDRIPARFKHLRKLLMYPYTYVFLSNKQGQSVVLRPELIAGKDLVFWEEAAFSEAGQRIQWAVDGYNSRTISGPNGQLEGLGQDYAVFINNLPQTTVTVDGGLLAIARSSQSIAFASRQADWNMRKGMAGNQLSFDQATAGIDMSTDMMKNDIRAQKRALGIDTTAANQNALGNTVSAVGTGVGVGAIMGPGGSLAGAVAGLAGATISNIATLNANVANENRLASGIAASRGANNIGGAFAGGIRDTNKAYADMATKGDYEMEIAGMKAATADLMASPPSAAGQAGGEALNFLQWRTGVDLQIRVMDTAHMISVGEYWLRYGYAIQRYLQIPQELQVMTKFTYWKIKDLALQGNVPDRFLATIRGIIETGVTVVEDPDEWGFESMDENEPLPGYTIGGITPPAEIPDPPVTPPTKARRKRKRMLVFSTVSSDPSAPGNTWALAGSAPGTDANFIRTQSQVRANAFLEATGQETPVGLTEAEFLMLETQYKSPVSTLVTSGDPA